MYKELWRKEGVSAQSLWLKKSHVVDSLAQQQCTENFLNIIGRAPSVSKSNGYTLNVERWHLSCFLYELEVNYLNTSKMFGKFPAVSNINRLFFKHNWFICNQHLVLPLHSRSLPKWPGTVAAMNWYNLALQMLQLTDNHQCLRIDSWEIYKSRLHAKETWKAW